MSLQRRDRKCSDRLAPLDADALLQHSVEDTISLYVPEAGIEMLGGGRASVEVWGRTAIRMDEALNTPQDYFQTDPTGLLRSVRRVCQLMAEGNSDSAWAVLHAAHLRIRAEIGFTAEKLKSWTRASLRAELTRSAANCCLRLCPLCSRWWVVEHFDSDHCYRCFNRVT